ncbi:MAG: DNA polymerase III subunit alpha [Patescibacteria group bacterium]
MRFVHLHLHSHYSLLDGLGKIPELVSRAKELGMDALALTDHGVLYGAIEFYQECTKAGIKPIIGMEAYIAPHRMTDRRPRIDDRATHLTLLAANIEGYRNLMIATTRAHLDGFYYKPRIDKEFLRSHAAGLIGLSGCLGSEIAQALAADDLVKAEAAAVEYRDIFGEGNFFLEVQDHPELPLQGAVNQKMFALSERTGIPTVATKDAHYIHPDDAEAQDVLLSIQTGQTITDPTRFSMRGVDYSLVSGSAIAAAFADHPEAIEATARIADRCTLVLELGKWNFPAVDLPPGETSITELRRRAHEGLLARIPNCGTETLERLQYELGIIEQKGFSPYFLVVSDYVNWARAQGIVTTTRGSAAGSLVSYTIGVTTVNPMYFQLPFERFLNPSRPSPPDIDVDFADNRRDEVLAYVTQKYGKDRVAQICTFGTMMARGVVRDVARALGHPYAFGDRLAKMIPFGSQGFPMTLEKAKEENPELKTLADEDAEVRRVLELAKKMEGCARHVSVHAAGVVISSTPLTDYTPLQRESGGEKIITQYEMGAVEAVGLLKMDFLGIRNLSILGSAVELIKKTKGETIDLENLPLDDTKTYELLGKGDTIGLFQLGGAGMTRYLRELEPSSIFDIQAMVALYRPGPIESIPEFIRRKKNPRTVRLLDPRMKDILSMSYGIITYQDDVLLIAIKLAGYTWEEADKLRKAMGKKIPKEMAAQKEKFIGGCAKNGLTEDKAQELWKLIEPFAAYGFNKCLPADVLLTDAETGERLTIGELYRSNRRVSLWTLGEDLKLHPKKIRGVQSNGVKPVYEVRMRSGRRIRATANHPLFTVAGWRALETLKVGERIAVPRALPEISNPAHLKNHELIALGYLLAEGNLCHPSGIYFYSKSESECQDFVRAASAFSNARVHLDYSKSATAVYVGKKEPRAPNALMAWIRELGLAGKKATEKYFPDVVFKLPQNECALLLGKLWQGDGCVHPSQGGQIFYATSSERLAEELQHLLLRLGIVSVIHEKRFAYRGGFRKGWTVNVSSAEHIRTFAQTVGRHLIGEKRLVLKALVDSKATLVPAGVPIARGTFDTIPTAIFGVVRSAMAVREFGVRETAEVAGVHWRLLHRDQKKKGYTRSVITRLGKALNDPGLERYGSSDVLWDEIREIRHCGEEETFDVLMPEPHNFVADDVIVHNSHAASYAMVAYQTAYLKAHFPAEFMTAVLTADAGDMEKVAAAVAECAPMNMEVLPPEVNESREGFTMVDDQHIRFGLLAIKNLGEDVVRVILEERDGDGPFRSVGEFIRRISAKSANKKSFEALAKSGALDALGERGKLLANMEDLLRWGRETRAAAESGQRSLFHDAGERLPVLHNAPPASREERLAWEKELLGLYLTEHPFRDIADALKGILVPCARVKEEDARALIRVGGIISHAKRITTRKGEGMMIVQIEDPTGFAEAVVFPRLYKETESVWREGANVMISGRRSARDEETRFIAEGATELTDAAVERLRSEAHVPLGAHERGAAVEASVASPSERQAGGAFTVEVPARAEAALWNELRALFTKHPGKARVFLTVPGERGPKRIETNFAVAPTPELVEAIRSLTGSACVTG